MAEMRSGMLRHVDGHAWPEGYAECGCPSKIHRMGASDLFCSPPLDNKIIESLRNTHKNGPENTKTAQNQAAQHEIKPFDTNRWVSSRSIEFSTREGLNGGNKEVKRQKT